ncbi:hypothetical protein SCG7086_CD_00010, partial [Chlamydiales bacterium SCGC AG-110-P3]
MDKAGRGVPRNRSFPVNRNRRKKPEPVPKNQAKASELGKKLVGGKRKRRESTDLGESPAKLTKREASQNEPISKAGRRILTPGSIQGLQESGAKDMETSPTSNLKNPPSVLETQIETQKRFLQEAIEQENLTSVKNYAGKLHAAPKKKIPANKSQSVGRGAQNLDAQIAQDGNQSIS